MNKITCRNCGEEVPGDSRFCNHCGAPIPQTTICQYCGEEIPAGSSFCPSCGHSLAQHQAVPPVLPVPAAPKQNDDQGWDFNEEEEEETRQKALAIAQQQQQQRREEESNYDYEPPKKRRSSAPFIAALLTALILGGAGFFFFQGRADANAAPTDTIEVPISPDEAAEIMRATLNKENRLGDMSNVAYAMEVNPSKYGERRIAGIAYYSSPNNRSFYKVYTLTRDSITSAWSSTREANRNIEGRTLNFDPDYVLGEGTQMPQHITSIEGKDYLYFAYAAMPQMGVGQGAVVVALYNVDTADIVNVTYEGDIVDRQGQRMVYGKVQNLRRTPEAEFLTAQAETAALIYHPTAEELELEKVDKAALKWATDNEENVKALCNNEKEVYLEVTTYNQPIFSLDDSDNGTQIENESMIVVADDKGAVYGFSKTKRCYFVIYAPKGIRPKASISFVDDGRVSVKSSDINFTFNARNCTGSSNS